MSQEQVIFLFFFLLATGESAQLMCESSNGARDLKGILSGLNVKR